MMDRRDFLKVLGVVSVAPVVVVKALEPVPDEIVWVPRRHYGKLPMAHTPLVEGQEPQWRAMAQRYERASFGANRSGKTDSHIYDCMTYAMQKRV